jgi:alanyl-tRNA synthetase
LVVIGADHAAKGALVALVSKDLVTKGVSAADVIAEAARELGGGGSRDPELAQAGGPRGESLDSALDRARSAAERALRGL